MVSENQPLKWELVWTPEDEPSSPATVEDVETVEDADEDDGDDDEIDDIEAIEPNSSEDGSKLRFGNPCTIDDLTRRLNDVRNRNLVKNESWGIKVWTEWAQYRNQSSASKSDQKFPIPEELNSDTDCNLVEYWMPYFLMEVKSRGGDYTPDSLKQLVYGIYRHLREHCNYNGESWLAPNSNVGKALYARIREIRRKEGSGLFGRRFKTMTREDEMLLWESGVLNLDTSQGLLYAAFIYNGKVLGVRGRGDHRALNVDQFVFKKTTSKDAFLEFWPHTVRSDKNNVMYKTSHQGPIRHYEDPNNPRSYYKIIHRYLTAVGDKTGAFYRKPLPAGNGNLLCYSKQPIGINQIGGMLKKIYESAGLNQSTSNLNNRALKVAAAMELHRVGVKRKFIAERTGHRSTAIDPYICNDPDINKSISKCLDPVSKFKPLTVVESDDVTLEVPPGGGVEKREVPKTKFSCGYKDNKFTIQIDLERKMGSVCSLEVRNEGKQVRMYFE